MNIPKRFCSKILILLIFFSLLISIFPSQIFASNMIINSDGSFAFDTTSTAATTGIKFRTVGFTVHRTEMCTSTQCDPQSGTHGEIRIQQVGPDVPVGNGQVQTFFEVPEEMVSQALVEAGLEDISYGGTIYLSAIFHVLHYSNNVLVSESGDFVDLQHIKGAESWANLDDFRQYYDRNVTYAPKFPVTLMLKKSTGQLISQSAVVNPDDPSHNWKPGQTITVPLQATLTGADGKTYRLIKSYLQSKHHLSDMNHIVTGVIAERNFTTYLGGTNVIAVYEEDEGTPPTDPAPQCSVVINPPSRGTFLSNAVLDPAASGVIRADHRDAEQFDVTQGIPTIESLYANVLANNYLHQYQFVNMTGTVTYTIQVQKTYNLTWTIPATAGVPPAAGTPAQPKERPETVTKDITVTRPYSYWQIDNLEIYKLSKSTLSNYALPGGSVQLNPAGYTEPSLSSEYSTDVDDHVRPFACEPIKLDPETVSGTTTEPQVPNQTAAFQSEAESSVGKNTVNNDSVVFNEMTIMDQTEVPESAPAPSALPAPTQIDRNVLYGTNYKIGSTLQNRANTLSSGSIYYDLIPGNVNGGSNKSFAINGINSVTVHTPVVNYSVIPDDNRPYDQRMSPDMTRTVLILDRPFTVHFTESGQHLNIPGYGSRDYMKYTLNKRIQFPFGVFEGSEYYSEGTWINIPVGTPEMTFTMPTWVNEGNYTVHTQSWAINGTPADPTGLCELNRNGDLNNYCASNSFDVGVVGRLFDFRIWDIGDFRFEKVFRTATGSTDHSPAMYYTGGNDENGNPTALYGHKQWFLPIRKGSHPAEQKTVPHNGYSFLFDFRTIGNLWEPGEGIRIEPTFWFVPKTGGSPAPVDLYYDISGTANKMIGVGSPKDTLSYKRTYRLADSMRNIPTGELSTAASYEYNYILSDAERAETSWTKFYRLYLKRKTTIGNGYNLEILPFKSRTLVGPTVIPASVNPVTAVRSVQHWYGEYHLPIAPYILPKGTSIVSLANHYGGALDGHEPEFLRGGYILVKFEIYTIKNGDANTRILGYKAPIANMWAIEGQMAGDTDELGQMFSFSSGDIIMFESDYSVRNDYQGQSK
ncbi:DUF5704 domain-containing protein [Paenibacillus sp. FSL H8-0259]|uniref:DUF5704 domain-containing protein n=2 Tax=Paenibacillus sp. FSL H8-0259 TaxID=1920423 RepID=UPI00117C0C87